MQLQIATDGDAVTHLFPVLTYDTFVATHKAKWCHNPEGHNVNQATFNVLWGQFTCHAYTKQYG
jgi:hypothetical protein